MKKKTATDTVLAVAAPLFLVGWVLSLIQLTPEPSWVRSAQLIFFVVAVYAIGATVQARAENRMDEVELAAVRFGARWGLLASVAFMAILIFLPPFQTFLTDSADTLRTFSGYPRAIEARMFMLGMVATFVAQEAFRTLLAAGWKWSKR